jgi:hypothetical protein
MGMGKMNEMEAGTASQKEKNQNIAAPYVQDASLDKGHRGPESQKHVTTDTIMHAL